MTGIELVLALALHHRKPKSTARPPTTAAIVAQVKHNLKDACPGMKWFNSTEPSDQGGTFTLAMGVCRHPIGTVGIMSSTNTATAQSLRNDPSIREPKTVVWSEGNVIVVTETKHYTPDMYNAVAKVHGMRKVTR